MTMPTVTEELVSEIKRLRSAGRKIKLLIADAGWIATDGDPSMVSLDNDLLQFVSGDDAYCVKGSAIRGIKSKP